VILLLFYRLGKELSIVKATKSDVIYDITFPLENACVALNRLIEDFFDNVEWDDSRLPTHGEWNALEVRLRCISDLVGYVSGDLKAVNGRSCSYLASKYHLFAAQNKEATK